MLSLSAAYSRASLYECAQTRLCAHEQKRELSDTVRDELRELTVHKANYEELLDLANREQHTRKERDRQ